MSAVLSYRFAPVFLLILVFAGVAGCPMRNTMGPDNVTADADNDGVADDADRCPGFDDQVDADNDNVPDGCDICATGDDSLDADADGVPDACDLCADSPDNVDADNDGVADGCDQCAGFNDALDDDGDGMPNGCDTETLSERTDLAEFASLSGSGETVDLRDLRVGDEIVLSLPDNAMSLVAVRQLTPLCTCLWSVMPPNAGSFNPPDSCDTVFTVEAAGDAFLAVVQTCNGQSNEFFSLIEAQAATDDDSVTSSTGAEANIEVLPGTDVIEGTTVQLDGRGSVGSGFRWDQLSGSAITLLHPVSLLGPPSTPPVPVENLPAVEFTAPTINCPQVNATFTFQLTITRGPDDELLAIEDQAISTAQVLVINTETCNVSTPPPPPPPPQDPCAGVTCNDTDNNPCTTSMCVNGTCTTVPAAEGGGCDDGNVCTQNDTCQSGTCAGTANPGAACDDGNACTQNDMCQANASCSGTNANAGTACSDGNVCNGNETCNGAGVCQPGTPLNNGSDCSAQMTCFTTATCQDGVCSGAIPLPPGTNCGNAPTVCSSQDTCDGAGVCQPNHLGNGTPCTNDGNPCTSDFCQIGFCVHPAAPAGTTCATDNNVCTNDVCSGTTCSHPPVTAQTACATDNNVCTNDVCAGGVCTHPAVTSPTACSDSNACTTNDMCSGSNCAGGPALQCNDGMFCNGTETCNPASGCVAGSDPCTAPGLSECNETGTGTCVQCTNNSHCIAPMTCSLNTFTCVNGAAVTGVVRRGNAGVGGAQGTLATGRSIKIEVLSQATGLALVPPVEVTITTGSYGMTIPFATVAFPFAARLHASSADNVSFEAADIDLTIQNTGGALPDFIAFYTFFADRPGDGIGADGNDNNSGTMALPLANPQTGANRCLPGDTVEVRAGTYDTAALPAPGAEATPVIRAAGDGTSTRRITFEAFGNEPVTLSGRAINRNAVRIENDFITVSKFTLTNCKREGATITATFRTCGSAQPPAGPPCFVGTSSGRTVTGCRINECVAFGNSLDATSFVPGIQIRGQVSDSIIENCASFNNGQGIGIEEESSVNTFRTYPDFVAPWPDAARNCTIRGCIAFDNRKSDENSDGVGGRYLTNCVIENNISFGNDDDAFDSVGTVNCRWIGNIAFASNPEATLNGDGNGLKISTRRGGGNFAIRNIAFLNPRGGFDDDDGTDNSYFNNLAYRNGFGVPAFGILGVGGMGIESDVGANSLVNNLAHLNNVGGARDVTLSRDCVNAFPFAPHATNFNYWGDGRPPFNPCNNVPFNDANSQAFGANTNGLTVVGDPMFVNPIDALNEIDVSAAPNVQPGGVQALVTSIRNQVLAAFALQPGSPLINAGFNIGEPFNGASPDIGPVESP